MVEAVSILDLISVDLPFPYFAEYLINGYRSWVYINMKDFYNWLREDNYNYYKELKGRHFFSNDNSLVEDFYNLKHQDRRVNAKQALSRYLYHCSLRNGLPDLSKRIDLQSMSELFREVQYKFLTDRSSVPAVGIKSGYTGSDYLFSKYGSSWDDYLIADGKRIGYEFSYDGADLLYADRCFRSMFYDSGYTHTFLEDAIRHSQNRVLMR